MNSESVAKVLGGMVAVFVLGAAVVYGPLGQFGKSKPPPNTEQAMQQRPAVATPPGVKGPVIREVQQ